MSHVTRASRRTRLLDYAGLSGVKLFASLALLGMGFHGVSDDDFARVVIAQEFAIEPKLDPSGTSWLPLPFWITGGAMLVFGRSLSVAFGVAVLLGILSVLLVYEAAKLWGLSRERALAAAAIVALLPWSVRLGVAPVPELPVAAACLLALASLACDRAKLRLGAAFLLLVACLSRYEPWFLVPSFAAYATLDALRTTRGRRERVLFAAATLTSLLAPLAWSLHNLRAHGSLTHYLDRVAAYKQAIDHGDLFDRATTYLFAVPRAEPELCSAVLLLLVFGSRQDPVSPMLRSARRAFVSLAVLFVALTVSSLRGGAPTHHPERALLVVHLTLAVLVAMLPGLPAFRRLLERPLWAMLGLAAVALCFTPLRAWVLYRESVAQRTSEIAIGKAIGAQVPEQERVLIEAVDYGFFATVAASTRPNTVAPANQVGPRAKGELPLQGQALISAARSSGVRFVVTTTPGGERELARHGRHCLVELVP